MLGGVAIFFLLISCWYALRLHSILLCALLIDFTRQLIITMVPKSGAVFHRRLLHTALSAPMKFFATTDTGVTLNRFSQDLSLIGKNMPVSFLRIMQLT